MKFGRIHTDLLAATDMHLPSDSAANMQVLGGTPAANPRIYLGCTQWKCDAWLDVIYPRGIRDTDILPTYIRHFNSIELNAMHYRIFPPETVARWAQHAAGTKFMFCPKFPQSISHHSGFKNTATFTHQFLESITALGPHLGPAFLQVSDSYGPAQGEPLLAYLASLPNGMPFFVDLRQPEWFASERQQATAQWLQQQGIGWVITDAPGRRDVCHMHLTTRTAFVRFLGNNMHPTDYPRIDAWVQRISQWLQQGLENLYFFMHHPQEAGAPELIDYMAEKLQAATGLVVKRPEFLARQGRLF
jgi:uncharacterized protein YecE (DUF72 family)